MFFDKLNATLELTISGTSVTITAGDLKNFEIELTPWGYSATADWWIICRADSSEDKLFTAFSGNELVTVTLTLNRAFVGLSEDKLQTPTPLVLKGLGLEKTVVESAFANLTGAPILHRHYTIRFGDVAAVLWSQHRPHALYVNKTLKDLVEANKPTGVTITHSWQASSVTYPVLSLGLGAGANGPATNNGAMVHEATYNDFMHWLLDGLNVGLYYDPAQDQYTIADAKPTSAAVEIHLLEVATLECVFPALPRNSVTLLNAYSEAATKTKDIPNTVGVTGVLVNYLLRSSIAADLDTRTTLETARAKPPDPAARITLCRFPPAPFVPGQIVKLAAEWSTNLFQNGKQYRIVSVHLKGKAEHQDATAEDLHDTNRYAIDYVLDLELDTDAVVHHAKYRHPVWPIYVEGKVLSEVGAADELTWQSYEDSQTSLMYYKIKIPLWDNQLIIVPFEPIKQMGHTFVPLYKDERVLIALYFDRARVRAFLDWRPGGALPLDTQGNNILMGKKDKNNTTINHVYTDQKPVLTIQRTLDADMQIIVVSEGAIKMTTKDH